MKATTSPNVIPRIRKGDLVKIVWRDACEGLTGRSLDDLEKSTLRQLVTSNVTTVGQYLCTIGEYVVLSDVIREESDQKLLYERRGQGKWLAIPVSAIAQVVPLGNPESYLINEVKRRRTIFKQLRMIPRSKRLPSGEMSRMLYVA